MPAWLLGLALFTCYLGKPLLRHYLYCRLQQQTHQTAPGHVEATRPLVYIYTLPEAYTNCTAAPEWHYHLYGASPAAACQAALTQLQ